MKKILVLFLLAIILQACAPQSEQAFHTSRSIASSSSLAPSKWSLSAFPAKLGISTDFSQDEIQAIEDMANEWSFSLNNQIQFFETRRNISEKNTKSLNDYNDNTLGVYKLNSWPSEFPATALAVTQIFGNKINAGSSNEYIKITHADIMINYENFKFSTDYGFGYDLQTVVLHEMGHFLGLYHDNISSDESIMYPSISRFVDNRSPKAKDIENINELYSLDLNLTTANRYNFPQKDEASELGIPVKIIFEIYPNGKERYKIQPR